MAAGKLIFDINQHTHPITGLEFHPNEFLLGTSSMDRSIKFWDLDTFELVDTAGPDALPARALRFTPDGTHMLAAQQARALTSMRMDHCVTFFELH
jgi:katanin p80 WD40 repeat-containing subunit B1